MARQFKLINANGNEYDMNRPFSFFWNPSGLGWGESVTTRRVGNTYVVTDRGEIQPNPSGTMVFRDYSEYDNFLAFCKIGGLILCYKTDTDWRYLKVTIKIDKTEIKPENERLLCPVTFTGLSYWYRIKTYTVQGSGNINLSLSGESYFKLTFTTINASNGCSYELWINGEITEKTGIINATDVPLTSVIVINTYPNELEISEYGRTNGNFIKSRYSESDFSTMRFFSLPSGESVLKVNGSVTLEVYENV